MKNLFKLNLYILIAVLASGCQTVSIDDQMDQEIPVVKSTPEPERVGVYHRVYKGETLWRIAKAYSVDIEDVVRINKIADVGKVEENQLVFIPGATSVKKIRLEELDKSNEFAWPVEGKVVRTFRQSKDGKVNRGIDIATEPGAVVKAARYGRVAMAEYLPGFGNTVIIDHKDGYFSFYSHNAKLLVKQGEIVSKRDPIANVGTENNESYLHFEIRRNSTEENPLFYLP